jgi:uncharacterized protein YggU (UPF0235/DUF167 family)
MLYIPISVARPSGVSPGAATAKNPNVTVLRSQDVLSFPTRDQNGINLVGNYVMKTGAIMLSVYMTPSSIQYSYESSGEEDAISVKQKFEGHHPGANKEILEFLQNNYGQGFIILVDQCDTSEKLVYGTRCTPLTLKPSGKSDKDSNIQTLMFESFSSGQYLPGKYTGSTVFSAPFAVVSAAAIAANPANGNYYKLPQTAAATAIAFATNTLTDRENVTLIGSGGAVDATLAASANVILIGSVSWVALENATITFQIVKSGATTILIEQSRT